MDSEYITVLQKKLDSLKEEKNKKMAEINNLLAEIDVVQKSVENIIQLLKIEGVKFGANDLKGLIQESIADLARDYLNSLSEKKPKHYKEIFSGILASGKSLPGKNPEANLLTHIVRDNRFVRVSPGTYGLLEWGIQVPKTNKRRKPRKK